MNNINIKTKVYTNLIIEEIQSISKKTIHYQGVVADEVKDILSDDSMLEAIASVAWDDEMKGVCAYTPEQLLELAPHGFNPCPIELFVNGKADLKTAIKECFSVTFSSVWDDDEWAENTGSELEELDFDLFKKTCGNNEEDVWLATDKEGNALCDLCPDCREKDMAGDKVIELDTKKVN
jgi:hypothetical protein